MKHCVIADDSAVVRKVVRSIMEKLGFRVSEAGDGDQALAVCRGEMPDLVLLDEWMPVRDGWGFLQTLRSAPHGTKPKVLLCMVERNERLITRARQAGADDYLLKPFDEQLLSAKLRQLELT